LKEDGFVVIFFDIHSEKGRDKGYMNDKANQVLSISSALLVGALIGAGVGFLTAPRSGEETRSMIRNKGTEFKEKASGAVTDTRERAGRLFNEIAMSTRERIPTLQHKAERVFEETFQNAERG